MYNYKYYSIYGCHMSYKINVTRICDNTGKRQGVVATIIYFNLRVTHDSYISLSKNKVYCHFIAYIFVYK